ncbi:Os01g0318600, partial [Oryza sativa Japonica Group]
NRISSLFKLSIIQFVRAFFQPNNKWSSRLCGSRKNELQPTCNYLKFPKREVGKRLAFHISIRCWTILPDDHR